MVIENFQSRAIREHAEQHFQRRVSDPVDMRRTLYFIDVYRWTVDYQDRWDTRAQLSFPNGPTLNLEANTDDLDQCEELIAKAFTTLGAKPYDSD